MLSTVLYALLATGGGAAEIRRRQMQQGLTLAGPAPQISGGAAAMQRAPMQSQLPQSQGTYYTRPSGPWPTNGAAPPPVLNQNLVIPAAQPMAGPQVAAGPGPSGGIMPPVSSDPSAGIVVPPADASQGAAGAEGGDTGRDLYNTPPALLGPNDTPGPASWADVLPDTIPNPAAQAPPENAAPVTAAVEISTDAAVNNLNSDQQNSLLENTSPEEFITSTPDFQELVLVTAQDKLAASEAKAEVIVEAAENDPGPQTAPDLATYNALQDTLTNMTEKNTELSKTLRVLLDLGLDILRSNQTDTSFNPTDVSGTPAPAAKQKRSAATILAALGAIIEASKLADQVFDIGISWWRKIKAA